MHATLAKFGFPATLVKDFVHWCILMRSQQVTLGALVLVAKNDAISFAGLPPDAYAELGAVTAAIEIALAHFQPFDKLNYIMLMMVDPQVHFHVLPRYNSARTYGELTFTDPGWPGVPDLKSATDLTEQARMSILRDLRQAFTSTC